MCLRLQSPVDPEDNFFTGLHNDVQLEVFKLLNFADLVSVSHTCRNFRKQIKLNMNKHAMAALVPFFDSHTDQVMNLLQFGRGCVSGHIITAVFNLQLAVCDFPKEIHIHVSRRGRRVLVSLLKEVMGLGKPWIIQLDERTWQLSFGAYKWDLPVSDFVGTRCCLQVHQVDRRLTVFVSPSDCVLPVMLCGLTMADMVAFTGRTLVSLYPKLTVQQLALLTVRFSMARADDLLNMRSELEIMGIQFLRSNKDWARQCGTECPSLVKSITEDLGLFHLGDQATDRVIEQWKLNGLWVGIAQTQSVTNIWSSMGKHC